MVQRHKGIWFRRALGRRGATRSCILRLCAETGRQTLPSGAKIRVVVRAGSRGTEVVRVIEVDTRGAIDRSSRRSTFDPSAAFDLTGKSSGSTTPAASDSSLATILAGTCSSTAPPSASSASQASSKARRCRCASSRRRRVARRLRSLYRTDSIGANRGAPAKGAPRSGEFVLAAQSAGEDAHHAEREKRGVLTRNRN